MIDYCPIATIPVPDVDRIDVVFGSIQHMPTWDSIPKDFRNMNDITPQNQIISQWFYSGLSQQQADALVPKDGVNKGKALAAIRAILASMEPKHEHKTAACAYLLFDWFKKESFNAA